MNAKLAKDTGLVKARGTYNGQVYWTRPGRSAIITGSRVLELAGY